MMFSPVSEKHWDRPMAAHLLNRAGFGGIPSQIDELVAMGPAKAVESILKADDDSDLFPPPSMLEPRIRSEFHHREKEAATEEEKKVVRKQLNDAERRSMLDLRSWWLNRMRYTSAPLREKATLFWHGHFATGNQKVNDPYLMWFQNETLRRLALGKFPEILKEMSRDPAMIRWLDLGQSRKDHPNENFAREVLELFSLGEGHYTEEDVREAARAFTGYRVDPETGAFLFREREFDPGLKSFFLKTGAFTGDEIIDLVVAQTQCARFIGRKLWMFFVSPDPSEETVSGVADLLVSNGYDIGATLGTIFKSADFYSPHIVHHQIKGPVQWMIQTTKMLGIPLPESPVLENSLSALGQVLFAPPNVKGWDGGKAWISASTLLYRYNLAAFLLSGRARVPGGGNHAMAAIPLGEISPPKDRLGPGELIDTLGFRIFNVPVPERDHSAFMRFLSGKGIPYDDRTVLDLMQLMMSTPDYQLC